MIKSRVVETKVIKYSNKIINSIAYLILIIMLLFSLASLWDIYMQYHRSSLDDGLTHLKPGEPDYDFSDLLKINPDVCAWLTLDGTKIDYPVLQGKDNSEYLDKDIYKKYYVGGSIYLDYRNSKNFSDNYNLLHGHHMDAGAMFGDLANYENEEYFNSHESGTLYTPDSRYELTIFACLSVDAFDTTVYMPGNRDNNSQQVLLKYIKKNAKNYRDINASEKDKLIAFSTCSSAFTNSRTVVVARMKDIGKNNNGEIRNVEDKTSEKND